MTKLATNPASSGPAGPLFEAQVAAHYLLSLLIGAEPRGLAGTTIERIEFQRASEGHALDDVIVHARAALGACAVLAIQVKRSITFAPADAVFRAAVAQIAETIQGPRFWESHYELAIAIARTTQKIDGAYQDVLAWARTLGSAQVFFDRIGRSGSANDDQRTFVRTVRHHLAEFGALHDDETVFNLLGRLQILTFDFTAPGSAAEELMRERALRALPPEESSRATNLWNSLTELALEIAARGGDRDRERLIQDLHERSFTRLAGVRDFALARMKLRDAADHALADIDDRVGSVMLTRHERLAAVRQALDEGRYVELRGDAGVGKSGLLKHLARQLGQESQVLVLSPNRTIPNGWLAFQAALRFDGGAHDLLVDIAASGGAILFLDNLDNFTKPEQKTAIDLVREGARIPGFSVVVSARQEFATEEPNWLPKDALDRLGRSPPVLLDMLNEAEIEELSSVAPALAILLAEGHPARDVVRNLYRLSRLSSLPTHEPVPRTEIDMAQQWWRSADGARDDGYRDRARLLSALAEQALAERHPLSAAEHPSAALEALVRSKTLHDLDLDRVSFHHDVLREWAVANLLHADASALDRLPIERVAPVWLARAVELTARMAIEHAADGARWLSLLEQMGRVGSHGSWRRAVLLSCVRSEAAQVLLSRLSPALLAGRATLLRELIRTVMAVDVVPLAETLMAAGVTQSAVGVELMRPSGPSWARLILWLLSLETGPPSTAIFEVAELYANWCMGMLGADALTPLLLPALYRWLMQIESVRGPGRWSDHEEIFGGDLKEYQLRELEESLRTTFVLFSNRVPSLAIEYLRALAERKPRDAAVESVLKFRGTLAQAAPAELALLTAKVLIFQETERSPRGGRSLRGPFGFADDQFLPASPSQGPFYELLQQSPDEGLQLIRLLVGHAITYYTENRAPGDNLIPVPSPDGLREFPWIDSYSWSREEAGHSSVTSSLMALEAWAHTRIESGVPIDAVLADILRPGPLPAAYLLVIVDILLSHWPTTGEAAIPFLASPELLCLDLQRVGYERGPRSDTSRSTGSESRGRASLESLRQRPSRRRSLETLLGEYARGAGVEHRSRLRQLLEEAKTRLGPPEPQANLSDPTFMVLHALNLIDPDNWQEATVQLRSGVKTNVFQYVSPPAETLHLRPQREAASPRERDWSFESALSLALEDPAQSSVELVASSVTWAQAQTLSASDAADEGKRSFREHAIFAAALILARDGSPELRANHTDWARGVFARALDMPADPGRAIRSGLRFNSIAIALVGLTHLLKDHATGADIRALIDIAAREEPAGAHGFALVQLQLRVIDERLPSSMLRAAFAACVRTRGEWNASAQDEAALEQQYQAEQRANVDAEVAWLAGRGSEPPWPSFPDETLRLRRGIRIRDFDSDEQPPPRRTRKLRRTVNHRAAAIWLRAASFVPPGECRWACAVINAYSPWTFRANGVGLAREEDVENAPDEWNQAYFELLASNLSGCDVADSAVDSICALPDEAFFDLLPTFLRALDGTYFDAGAIDIGQIVGIRIRLADRLGASAGWRRLRGGTSDRIEMHIGPAIAVLFFNYFHAFAGPAGCYLTPAGAGRIEPFLPRLIDLVTAGPCIFVALVVLNLLEVAPTASQLSLLHAAADAWLEVYPDDTVFWQNKGVGRRICAVIERIWRADSMAIEAEQCRRVEALLAALVRLGVAEASALERALASSL